MRCFEVWAEGNAIAHPCFIFSVCGRSTQADVKNELWLCVDFSLVLNLEMRTADLSYTTNHNQWSF